jgi:predicted small lipoprotein YifL
MNVAAARVGLVALLATATLLCGCGQKGPLYLPDGKNKKTPVPATTPAPAATPATSAPDR